MHIIGDRKPQRSPENKEKIKNQIEDFLGDELQEYLMKKGFKLDGKDMDPKQLDSIYEALLGFYDNLRHKKVTKAPEAAESKKNVSEPKKEKKNEENTIVENVNVEEDAAEEGKSKNVKQIVSDEDKSVKININLNTEGYFFFLQCIVYLHTPFSYFFSS